ncbi:MAG: transporter substrate-binding protein [Sphingomonas bacterium]|nr:transporter substrate-binding protein [Sphingomonas bacterium]
MTKTTLWYTRCPTPTAFSISIHKGWIDEEFLSDDITISSLTTSTETRVRQSHFDSSQKNFFRHGGNSPPIVSRSRGADTRVIALSWNKAYRPLLALPGSGIETIADLRGRRVSVPRRLRDSVDFWHATALRGVSHALRDGGLSASDIIPVEVATDRTFIEDTRPGTQANGSLWDARFMLGHQREEAFALIRGEVDAFYSQGAMAVIVEGFLGAVTVHDIGANASLPGRGNNDVPYILTASGQLIDERPDLVERVLTRVLAASEWSKTHEQESKRIIAKETGLAEELVDRAFSPDVHRELDIDFAPEKVAALRSQHDHLLAHGFLKEAVDFELFLDPGPLLRAREALENRDNRAVA